MTTPFVPFTLVFFYSHIPTTKWKKLKNELFRIHPNVRVRVTRNTTMQRANLPPETQSLFQGPTCVLESPCFASMQAVCSLLKKYPEFFLLGGHFENLPVTPLDIERALHLGSASSVYNDLLTNVQGVGGIAHTLGDAPRALLGLLSLLSRANNGN